MKLIHHLYHDIVRLHAFDYIIFAIATILFVIGFHRFAEERYIGFVLISLFVAFYITWGMYHHAVSQTLHMRILLEYVLMGFTILFIAKIFLMS